MTLRTWLGEHLAAHPALLDLGAPSGPGAAPAPDTDRDRALAWRIHTELRTRITTQQLGFRSGDDAAALSSIGEFFKLAREAVAESGPSGTAELVVLLLNDTLRPFTSRWHRGSERGLLARDDGRRRFRVELEELRLRLRWWDALFRHVADGSPVGPLPSLEPRVEAAAPRIAGTDTLPHRRVADAEEARLPSAARSHFGIAFSGGGIRSASFCMGVMLGLARTRIYEGADFVSSVSGGGYLVTLLRSAREHAPGLGCNPLRSTDGGESPLLTQVRARSSSMWDHWHLALLRLGLAWALSAAAAYWVWVAVVFLWRCRGYLPGLSSDLGAAPEFRDPTFWIWAVAWVVVPWLPALDSLSPAAFYLHYLERIWVVAPGSAAARAAARRVAAGAEPASSVRPVFLRTAAHNRAERSFGADTYDAERLADVASFSAGLVDVGGAKPEALAHAISDVDAMAVSGAAVAPSLGISTRWWLRPILAGAGARLGRWIRMADRAPRRCGPPLYLFLCEMFGLPDPLGRFRFFSDGGHIENLGVYPLLRRRLPYILAIDGEADPTMAFDGLRQLQRLALIDLGVELDIDTTGLDPGKDGLSDTHVAVIRIRYPEIREGDPATALLPDRRVVHPAAEGVIIYVKSSLTGDEPSHVLGYKQTHPSFPHESTMIQWFNERQFEAYRALGEHVGRQLVSPEWMGRSMPKPEDLDGPTWVAWLRSRVQQS